MQKDYEKPYIEDENIEIEDICGASNGKDPFETDEI